MEVFANRNLDPNSSDQACGSVRLPSSATITQSLKDDFWFTVPVQDDARPVCTPLAVASDSPSGQVYLSHPALKSPRDDGGQTEAIYTHGFSPCCDNPSHETTVSNGSAPPWKRNGLWNTNNSSKTEQVRQTVPCSRWGHVMFGTLFDPRRTFPGFGFLYSRNPRFRQGSYRQRKEPPAFGYLDPSAMVCEYLHNYRNFLRDLRLGMRRGKNYEQAIMWGLSGDAPAYLRPAIYSEHPVYHHLRFQPSPLQPRYRPLFQYLPPAQCFSSQQHVPPQPPEDPLPPVTHGQPQVPDVSPGLMSVLSEISTPQSRDLQLEFSRLMRTVTSTNMRRIWMEGGGGSHDAISTPRCTPSGPPAASGYPPKADPVPASRESAVLKGGGDHFMETDTVFHADKVERYDDYKSSMADVPSEARPLCPSACPGLPASPPDPQDLVGGGYKNVSNNQVRQELTANHTLSVTLESQSSAVISNPGPKKAKEDEEDISLLIDSARLELQIEEEEEELVKQDLQLQAHQPDQQQDPGSFYNFPTNQTPYNFSDGSQIASENSNFGFTSLPSGTACDDSRENKLNYTCSDYEFASKSPEPKVEPTSEEPNERQILFVLRKSTVNHHLSQDLLEDDTGSAVSYSIGPHNSGGWHSATSSVYSLASSAQGAASQDSSHSVQLTSAASCLGSYRTATSSPADSAPDLPCGQQEDVVTGRSDGQGLYGSSFLTSRLDFKCCVRQLCDDTGSWSRDGAGGAAYTAGKLFSYSKPEPAKDPPSKIRILGSKSCKSYAEAYAESAPYTAASHSSRGGHSPEASRQDKEEVGGETDVTSRPQATAKPEGVGGAVAGAGRDPNRKPVIVSVRPLSHAARRGSHSYLTQRHSNRHRQTQTQTKSQGARQRQEPRADSVTPDRWAAAALDTGDLAPAAGAVPDPDKLRARTLCATNSAHQTLNARDHVIEQDLLAQRRSASESDVFCDTEQRSWPRQVLQTFGAGDITTVTASANITAPESGQEFASSSSAADRPIGGGVLPLTRQGDKTGGDRQSDGHTRSITLLKHVVLSREQPQVEVSLDLPQVQVSHGELQVQALDSGITSRRFSPSGSHTSPAVPLGGERVVEGTGWKLARRQVSTESQRPPRAAAEAPVHVKAPASSVVAIATSRLAASSFASSQCLVLAPVVSSRVPSPGTCAATSLSSNAPLGVDTPSTGSFRKSECFSCKLLSSVSEPVACSAAFRQEDTEGGPEPAAAMTEAAFAEQIACSPFSFQPDSFHKYWQGSAGAEDIPEGSASDGSESLSRSLLLRSMQAQETSTSGAVPSAALHEDAQCEDAGGKISILLSERRNSLKNSADFIKEKTTDGGSMFNSFSPRTVLQADAVHDGSEGVDQEVADQQPGTAAIGKDWLPLSVFIPHYKPPAEATATDATTATTVTTSSDSSESWSKKLQAELTKSNDFAVTSGSMPCATVSTGSEWTSAQSDGRESAAAEAVACGLAEGGKVVSSTLTASAAAFTPGAQEGEHRSTHKERILEEVSAWFVHNPGSTAMSKKEDGEVDNKRCIPVRISQRNSVLHVAQRPDEGEGQSGSGQDSYRVLLLVDTPDTTHPGQRTSQSASRGSEDSSRTLGFPSLLASGFTSLSQGSGSDPTLGSDLCPGQSLGEHESTQQAATNHPTTQHQIAQARTVVDQETFVGHSVSRSIVTQSTVTQQNVSRTLMTQNLTQQTVCGRSEAGAGPNVFSEGGSCKSASDGRYAADSELQSWKLPGDVTKDAPQQGGGTTLVRMDHLCNQHLIPEQFRKLIVPDMEKMMQMGRDNAWDSPQADPTQSASSKPSVKSDATPKPDLSLTSLGGENGRSHSVGMTSHTKHSHGIRITAEELFANYEAAVIGARSSQTIKAEALHDDVRQVQVQTHATLETQAAGVRKTAAGTSLVSAATVIPPRTSTSCATVLRHQSMAPKILLSARGASLEPKNPQPNLLSFGSVASRDVRVASSLPTQPVQSLAYSTHAAKGSEQVMTAAYYTNTRLNDVISYASINIPGLPRIPILSPQAAAQNAFLMKANSLRPCLQPNLSVPPPGFIPLMPVPTGPTFHHHHHHHGPSAYPLGPIFQPGVFHSPNFIAMTSHPPAPTFLQQTKVNICANVNINSSVSATFNVSNKTGAALNSNNNTRVTFNPASSLTTTTLTSSAAAFSETAWGKSSSGSPDGEGRGSGKVPGLPAVWAPFLTVKAAAAGGSKTVASKDAQTQGGLLKGGEDGDRSQDDVRSEADRWRCAAGAGGAQGESTATTSTSATVVNSNRPRGSNIDNLIHVFPPRQ